eukprot:7339135-Prymnesium_polylepis.2
MSMNCWSLSPAETSHGLGGRATDELPNAPHGVIMLDRRLRRDGALAMGRRCRCHMAAWYNARSGRTSTHPPFGWNGPAAADSQRTMPGVGYVNAPAMLPLMYMSRSRASTREYCVS